MEAVIRKSHSRNFGRGKASGAGLGALISWSAMGDEGAGRPRPRLGISPHRGWPPTAWGAANADHGPRGLRLGDCPEAGAASFNLRSACLHRSGITLSRLRRGCHPQRGRLWSRGGFCWNCPAAGSLRRVFDPDFQSREIFHEFLRRFCPSPSFFQAFSRPISASASHVIRCNSQNATAVPPPAR
jgi:hypothetical protein